MSSRQKAKLCRDCAHWAANEVGDFGALVGAGKCSMARQVWDVTNRVDEDGPFWGMHLELKPEHAALLSFVEDGSRYAACLITMPDFGCVQHQQRAAG